MDVPRLYSISTPCSDIVGEGGKDIEEHLPHWIMEIVNTRSELKFTPDWGELALSSRSPSSYLTDWPDKSAAHEGDIEHPAACHMLDVAAVAEVLLAATDPTLPPGRRDLFCLLVALHDLGKIGVQFRRMLWRQGPQTWRHWQVTEAWLRAEAMEDLICDRIGGSDLALQPLVAARHGRGPSADAGDGRTGGGCAGPRGSLPRALAAGLARRDRQHGGRGAQLAAVGADRGCRLGRVEPGVVPARGGAYLPRRLSRADTEPRRLRRGESGASAAGSGERQAV